MCLVGRVFVLMGSFSSVLVRSIFGGVCLELVCVKRRADVRSIFGGAFVDSFSVCLSDTILISICALAHWLGFDFRGLKKSAVNGILFRGLHLNREIILLMLV